MNNYEKLKARAEQILGETFDELTMALLFKTLNVFNASSSKKIAYVLGIDGGIYIHKTHKLWQIEPNADDVVDYYTFTEEPVKDDDDNEIPPAVEGVFMDTGLKLDATKPLSEQDDEGMVALGAILDRLTI
jgi:hypothetical protein